MAPALGEAGTPGYFQSLMTEVIVLTVGVLGVLIKSDPPMNYVPGSLKVELGKSKLQKASLQKRKQLRSNTYFSQFKL